MLPLSRSSLKQKRCWLTTNLRLVGSFLLANWLSNRRLKPIQPIPPGGVFFLRILCLDHPTLCRLQDLRKVSVVVLFPYLLYRLIKKNEQYIHIQIKSNMLGEKKSFGKKNYRFLKKKRTTTEHELGAPRPWRSERPLRGPSGAATWPDKKTQVGPMKKPVNLWMQNTNAKPENLL